MNPLIFNSDPIDFDRKSADPQLGYDLLFQELQGDIVKEHGRDYTKHLLVQFKKNTTVARRRTALAKLAERVTSARRQREQAIAYKTWVKRYKDNPAQRQEDQPNELFCGLVLSAEGYRQLGFSRDHQLPSDPAFRLGFKQQRLYEQAFFPKYGYSVTPEMIREWHRARNARTRYGKEVDEVLREYQHESPFPPHSWDDSYKGDIHVMVLLGLDNIANPETPKPPPQLDDVVHTIEDLLDGVATVVQKEAGITYYNKPDRRKQLQENDDRKPVEHFGFVDGISNPLFLAKDIADAASRERIINNDRIIYREVNKFDKYDPSAPLSLVLTEDPNGGPHGYGSYMVFMKLEQDVSAFCDSIDKLAKNIGVSSQQLAEGMVMGRFKDGTPLTMQSRSGLDPIPNNFSYFYSPSDDDRPGMRCPLHAHIRKVNRRDTYRDIRIVRRGITYGTRTQRKEGEFLLFDDQDKPKGAVGLLFASYQRDIERQFGAILKHWAMEDTHAGYDPILGQIVPGQGKQKWRDRWGNDPNAKCTDLSFPLDGFKAFVKLKGGEYFFAPSISFLKSL